jgi:hypothetical protein
LRNKIVADTFDLITTFFVVQFKWEGKVRSVRINTDDLDVRVELFKSF